MAHYPRDNHDHHERIVGREPPGEPMGDGVFQKVSDAILAYRIFPPTLVVPVLDRTPLQVGDTVGLTYALLPGIRMFVASRVIDRFDRQIDSGWETGFTYRTLDGHAELGEETFAVRKNRQTGEVTASMTAWSRPGHWLTRIGYWYARWCQLHAGRSALDWLHRVAREQ
jgi:uncharacterized protein (UPF0548 family)